MIRKAIKMKLSKIKQMFLLAAIAVFTVTPMVASAAEVQAETPAIEGAAETTEAAPEAEMAAEPSSITYIGQLNDKGGVTISGEDFVFSEKYSAEEVPAGFSEYTLTLGEHTYKQLKSGDMILVYLKPESDTSQKGTFLAFEEATGRVGTYRMVTFAGGYVLISDPPNGAILGMTEVDATADFGTYTAYNLGDIDVCYIYGTDNTGYTGWFNYEYKNDRVSKADTNVLTIVSNAAEPEKISTDQSFYPTAVYTKKMTKLRVIISVLVILLVIAIFAIIKFIRDGVSYGDDDVFDDDYSRKNSEIDFSMDDRKIHSEAEGRKTGVFAHTEEEDDLFEVKPSNKRGFFANLLSDDFEEGEDDNAPKKMPRRNDSDVVFGDVAPKDNPEHLKKPSEIAAEEAARAQKEARVAEFTKAINNADSNGVANIDLSVITGAATNIEQPKKAAKPVTDSHTIATTFAPEPKPVTKANVASVSDDDIDLAKIDISAFMNPAPQPKIQPAPVAQPQTRGQSVPVAQPKAQPTPAPKASVDDDIDLPLIDISAFTKK